MKNLFETYEADGITLNKLAFLNNDFGFDPSEKTKTKK